jgi:hypothetical protein
LYWQYLKRLILGGEGGFHKRDRRNVHVPGRE